jgi:predicted CXXCH cytochrome family protein
MTHRRVQPAPRADRPAGRAWLAVSAGAVLLGSGAAAQTRPTRITEFCASSDCHVEIVNRAFVHEPTGKDACLDCHAYASAREHTFRLNRTANAMCAGECHAESTPQGVTARRLHEPMADGCTACHDPHGSAYPALLREPETDLCLSCHKGIKSLLETSTIVHSPTVEGDGCATCHDPHAMRAGSLRIAPQPALCLDCHDEPLESVDGRPLTNMAALLADNAYHHGPISDGNCVGCHEPHAGMNAGLLLEPYPPEFYAEFEDRSYTLCFRCHPQRLVESEHGTGLTGFRDGDLNLHWLHVNRPKGRTCRTCHEVHASSHPFHMREAVPFGDVGWMLKIRYVKTADGGTCAPGCHVAWPYRRSLPEAYGDGG